MAKLKSNVDYKILETLVSKSDELKPDTVSQNLADHEKKLIQNEKDILFQGKILNITLGFVVAVLATLFIGFIQMLQDNIQNAANTHLEYSNLLNQLNNQKDDQILRRIEELESATKSADTKPTN